MLASNEKGLSTVQAGGESLTTGSGSGVTSITSHPDLTGPRIQVQQLGTKNLKVLRSTLYSKWRPSDPYLPSPNSSHPRNRRLSYLARIPFSPLKPAVYPYSHGSCCLPPSQINNGASPVYALCTRCYRAIARRGISGTRRRATTAGTIKPSSRSQTVTRLFLPVIS